MPTSETDLTKAEPGRADPSRPRRPVNRTGLAIGAVAIIAVIAVLALLTTTSVNGPATPAAPAAAPVEYRPLAGVGSDTTSAVLSALSDDVRDIGSYEAVPSGSVRTKAEGCTIDRPATDAAALAILVAQPPGAAPCVDFVRASADMSGLPTLADAGLTFIPFAVDATTFAQRADSPNPRSLTAQQLTDIYSCVPATTAAYLPVLPPAGSGLRLSFLSAIGLVDGDDFTATNPCVSEVNNAESPENFGQELTDPRHIAPYSVAQYLAQTNGVVSDRHVDAILGSIDGVAPTRPSDNPAVVGIVRRADSLNASSLTTEQLTSLYTCTAGESAQNRYRPLLPGPGSQVRASFLQALGLTDSPEFATTHPCVTQTGADGQVLAENTGTALTDPRDIAPYSIEQYLRQVGGLVPDVHGETVLAQADGIAPVELNADFPFTHEVYNVVPSSQVDQAPIAPVFAGSTAAVCLQAATITRYGFGVAADCGDTSTRTPR